VLLDLKLRWNAYLRVVKARIVYQQSALDSLTALTWKASLKVEKRIYKAVIRPMIIYSYNV
jgi:hypothetical protein